MRGPSIAATMLILLLTLVSIARAQDLFAPNGKSISLPHDVPTLPPGPGRANFIANCQTCHSPRYVFNQPPFPKKTWNAEVNKMIKVYGAPIPQSEINAIVGYLVSVNGREEGQP